MAPEFARSIQKLPVSRTGEVATSEDDEAGEKKRWLMAASRGEAAGSNRTFARKVADAWSAFVDLLKVCLINVSLVRALIMSRKQKRLTLLL